MLKTQAIKNFLDTQPYTMCKHYSSDMEVQVNVYKANGEPISGVVNGHKWRGFSDGLNTWKSFRIPWNAKDAPAYTDSDIGYDLSIYAEAIGMTGWDWKNKRSRWVGFDFDSLIGHKQGLTDDQLEEIKRRLGVLPFINYLRSTGGNGIHVYVTISDDTEIANHTEHAAVARSILAKISALSGLELESKVDTLGGNMWVWHKNAKPDISYRVFKLANENITIPPNWRDFLALLNPTKRETTDVDSIVAAKQKLELHDDHISLLRWFESTSCLWWFDDVKQMLVCHTYDLKRAHLNLRFKGLFDTVSVGREQGHDQNCFCFPCADGSWIIRRHTRGVKETNNWFTDSHGWTTCYYNRLPTLDTASRISGGVAGDKYYSFRTLTEATKALLVLGIDCKVPPGWDQRPAILEELKDGKLHLSVDGHEHDEHPNDWIKKKKKWERFFYYTKIIDELDLPDDIVRHVITNDASLGWFCRTNNNWIAQNRSDLISVMLSKGIKPDRIDHLLGIAIVHNWKMVNKPFKPEYPGNREWNKHAAQLRYKPEKGTHESWDKILEHCGRCLNDRISQLPIRMSGRDYLLQWCAALIQCPEEPLPYLFFTGPQGCGKSIFHESLSLLFTTGYCRADNSLINPSGFNGELAGSIVCIVEETNLSKRGTASDRIKDWVTGRTINVHTKGRTPYLIPNTTHWIQCANSLEYCPVLPGDTRITLLNLDPLEAEIPKRALLESCEKEAAAFLHTLLNLELLPYEGRLRIPVIETDLKTSQMASNASPLDLFIIEFVHRAPGYVIRYSDFFDRFYQYIQLDERIEWSNKRVSKELPFVKGRYNDGGYLFIGNVSWKSEPIERPKLKLVNGKLVSAEPLLT